MLRLRLRLALDQLLDEIVLSCGSSVDAVPAVLLVGADVVETFDPSA